jgi:hypothetical protein
MAKPTILLLPGAWHSPAHYEKIRKELDKHGYETEAIALATVDPKDPPNTDGDSDVKVISAAIQNILTSGKDVVLVTHSYSGIPGQSAAHAFIKESQTNGPRLIAIAMMCSFLYPPQMALTAPVGNKPLPIHVVSADGNLVDIGGPGPEHLFYNDVSPKEATQAKSLLKTHSWRCKIMPPSAKGVGYFQIPTSYLICEKDNAIPVGLQRKMIEDANELLKGRGSALRIREETVQSGHSPFLSMTERTAEFIRRTAGEDLPVSGDGVTTAL